MTGKSPDAFRTISEVADWLDRPAHVLRFWESKFSQVKPVKRAGGRRYYRPDDMLLLGGIKKLLHDDGMTIKGAQKVLREQGVRYVSALSQPLDDDVMQGDRATHVPDTAANLHNAPADPVTPINPVANRVPSPDSGFAPSAPGAHSDPVVSPPPPTGTISAPDPAPEQPIDAPSGADATPISPDFAPDIKPDIKPAFEDDETAAPSPLHQTSQSAAHPESSDPVMLSQPKDETLTPPSSSTDAQMLPDMPPPALDADGTQPASDQNIAAEPADIQAQPPSQPPAPIAAKALGADIPPDPDLSVWPPEPGLLSQIAALSGPIAQANRADIATLITRLDALRSHMATARKS